MIAHKALGLSLAAVLVGLFAGADAGKCFEVLSVDSTKSYLPDGSLFNFLAADTDLPFDGTTSITVTVEHYRNGASINDSLKVMVANDNSGSPSVGDSWGYLSSSDYTAGRFETGDYLCLFPGEMMAPIPESSTGVGSSACTGYTSLSNTYYDSVEECQQKCLLDSDCNTINYCSNSSGCGTSTVYSVKWCQFKKCYWNDYKISTTLGIYDIYTKMNESCSDMVQNQMEDDVDCGGPNCAACPSCSDNVKNQDEEDVDCGGSCPDACPTCDDKVKNQDEEDIDCGGSTCDACPSCTDGIKNQDEEDIDCGGACDVCPCKNKLTRQQCNGKFKNGKCNKPWVQKRCKATCGHYSMCCGNKMGDQRCERLKPYCNANWIVPEWIARKVGNRCQKTCGKCPN